MTTNQVNIQAGSLVVLSGLPAAGKSTLRQMARGFRDLDQAWLSMDSLREQILGTQHQLDANGEIFVDVPQSANERVFAILAQMVTARLEHGRTCILDGTWPTDADRGTWADLAKKHGAPFQVLILDTPLEACLAANALRLKRVPEQSIREINQPPAPPPVVNRNGKAQEQTAPMPFMRTSAHPYQVIDRYTVINQVLPSLEDNNWDVVGDVHGLTNELLAFLATLGWALVDGVLRHPDNRKILFLGDLVDRGYDSLGLLRIVRNSVRAGTAVCLKGNHEDKLVRFYERATTVGIEKWTSLSNADTGVELLKSKDAEALVEFIRQMPSYLTWKPKDGLQVAFVHGDVHTFDAELSTKGDLVYGQSGFRRGVDQDAQYQKRYDLMLNAWTLFRGHIPQTSVQENVFSLEQHAFENGKLLAIRLDDWLACLGTEEEGMTQRQAFEHCVRSYACEYSYEKVVQERYAATTALEQLAAKKAVHRQFDDSKLLRVFKYSKQTFWDNNWGLSPWLLKARGLVLDPAGQVVSHPFDKVFNFQENGAGVDLPADTPLVAIDKLNGFLGVVSAHPFQESKLLVHTQGGFGGEFVGYINDYLTGPVYGKVRQFLSKEDVTLMFEVLHPDDPHIIETAEHDFGLWLIGVRGKKLTDQPWTEDRVDEAAKAMGLRRPAWTRTTKVQLLALCRDEEGRLAKTEGWMARLDTPEQPFVFKLKTPYYLTTKFLGRLSVPRIKHMYGNPQQFKQTIDEEFYVLVDKLVEQYPVEQLLAMSDVERVQAVRNLIHKLL